MAAGKAADVAAFVARDGVAPDAGGGPQPKAHKQMLLLLAVIYPLTLAVPWAIAQAAAALPWSLPFLVEHLLGTATIVFLMVYAFMPRLTRWAAGWLHR